MKLLVSRKRLVSVAFACLLSFGALAAYASETSNPVHACLAPGGIVKVVSNQSECRTNETAISLASNADLDALQSTLETEIAARQAADAALTSRIEALETASAANPLVSPDGNFSISVSNSGISLIGPAATVDVTAASVAINGMTVSLMGTATTQVNGGVVQLNCGSANPGFPVARVGDTITGAGIGSIAGIITSGSESVLAC